MTKKDEAALIPSPPMHGSHSRERRGQVTTEDLLRIPQFPTAQMSLEEQIIKLHFIAIRLGLDEAAEYLRQNR